MLKKLFTVSLVLYPILSAYTVFGPADLGVTLCAVLGVGMLFLHSKKIKILCPEGYWAFLAYVLLAAVLVTHAVPLRILLYTFVLVVGCMFCDMSSLYSYYKKVAFVCIIYFIFQEAVRLSVGVNVPGIFTFLPVIYGDSASYVEANMLGKDRSASFFLEPSYFAQFLFPLVAMELFWNNEHDNIRNAVILSIVLFLIRSGNGILLLGIIWVLWLYFSSISRKIKRRIVYLGIICAIVLFAVQPEFIHDLLKRANELSFQGADMRWQSSGFIRFFRGYYLYASLPFINQLFGLNPGELDTYMLSNSLGLFDSDTSFINGAQTILCLYGAFGLFFFFRHLYLMGKHAPLVCVVLLVGIIYLMLSESFFISSRMLLTIVLTYLIKHRGENIIPYQHLPRRQ